MNTELMKSLTPDQNLELLEAMRNWVKDCQWGDLDEDEIDSLTDAELLRGVKSHYSGGIDQFIQDSVLIN